MHRGFRVETLLREILRLWLRMTGRGAGCFGTGLPVRFVSARRGHDPAVWLPEPWHFRLKRTVPPIVIGEAQPKDLMHQGSVSKPSCARSFAFGSE